LSIKSDTDLIVTPEQYVDRDDNTTGNNKKDEPKTKSNKYTNSE
jgi:hypothetical protein